MSINTDPTKSCAGKTRFDAFSEANKVARRPSRRNARTYRPYKCQRCGGFHIGTTISRNRRSMRPTSETTYSDEP